MVAATNFSRQLNNPKQSALFSAIAYATMRRFPTHNDENSNLILRDLKKDHDNGELIAELLQKPWEELLEQAKQIAHKIASKPEEWYDVVINKLKEVELLIEMDGQLCFILDQESQENQSQPNSESSGHD